MTTRAHIEALFRRRAGRARQPAQPLVSRADRARTGQLRSPTASPRPALAAACPHRGPALTADCPRRSPGSPRPTLTADCPRAARQGTMRSAGRSTARYAGNLLAGVSNVRFLGGAPQAVDLTYSDVFMVPSRGAVASRLDVDLSTRDGSGTTIPVVAANMTAVSGRRMAETIARRGGIAVLPQDIPVEVVAEVVSWVKRRHLVHDTPITLGPGRHHRRGAQPAAQASARRRDRRVGRQAGRRGDRGGLPGRRPLHPAPPGHVGRVADPARRHRAGEGVRAAARGPAPSWHLWWTARAGSPASSPAPARCGPRCTSLPPTRAGRLRIAAAAGVNGDVISKANALAEAGVDLIVVDTAHGHQEKMIAALAAIRGDGPGRAACGREHGDRQKGCVTSSRRARTSSRSASGPAPCARPG